MGCWRSTSPREMAELKAQGVTVRFLGDLDRLARARSGRRWTGSMAETGARQQAGAQHLHLLRLAGRDRPRRAAARGGGARGPPRPGARSTRRRSPRRLYTAAWPDPDLLIRTSGELRLSNFLLWQLAYAELYVTPVLWPDFSRRHLFEAILEYQRRDRRFGKVSV